MIQRITTIAEYEKQYNYSIDDPEIFWKEIAETFTWKKQFTKVLNWEFDTPNVRWFEDGELNITYNCIDRHLPERKEDVAFYWEPNQIEANPIEITFQQLHDEVCKAANGLKELGVKKGDRVCIYMPMIPELIYTVLACARIGAIHSVVFAGFSAKALRDRIDDAKAVVLVTASVGKRGNKTSELESIVDTALEDNEFIQHVLVVQNSSKKSVKHQALKHSWEAIVEKQNPICEPEIMKSEDPLFILYTSGSTGKPKGVVHTIGGYMVYTSYSFVNVFQYEPGDVYWCTADVGWITGHSYMIYGPLLSGATSVIFEGVPTYPDPGRFWQVCEKYKVNQFYTAPTAIRALMVHDTGYVKKYDLSSLKVLGTVGEPINDEAWHWYNEIVGGKNCPIVDTWWQTETGGIMIAPLAGITDTIPTFATKPLPGIQPVLLDANGNEITENEAEGNLCIQFPWPSMIRTTWGDHERCKNVYFSMYPGYYVTGDGCKRDANGNYRITGRIDDVINVSGHRIGTAEVEDAIDGHEDVVEAAVVGFPHAIKGEGIFAFVIVKTRQSEETLKQEIISLVNTEIGPIAKPDKIIFVEGLPKTRSGKIMRRILRKLAAKAFDELGDVSTLLDPTVVEEIRTKL